MEDGHNWRIWNWSNCVEIQPTTICLRLNGNLGRYVSFVMLPVEVSKQQVAFIPSAPGSAGF